MDGIVKHKKWNLHYLLPFVLLTAFRITNADLDGGTIYSGRMAGGLQDLAPLPLSDVVRPAAVDYDPQERMIYWSDLNGLPSPKISRANLDGSNQMTIAQDLRLPDGLALDIEARMLYWTDGVIGYVGRVRMNGTGDQDKIVEGLDQPRTIVADHSRGYIFWSDWGSSPKIERADLDGGNRRSVVNSDLHWPNGVTIDGDYLYWCDAFLDKLEKSDLTGASRVVVLDLTAYGDLHPFDLDVSRGDVYWTDWKVPTLVRVNVNGRGEGNFGPSTFQKAAGIHIQEEPNNCDSSPCNNGASCQDVIGGFVCQCPPGFQGSTCSSEPNNCDSSPCNNGASCQDVIGGFVCQCPPGFQGSTCSSEPNNCDSSPCNNGASCQDVIGGFVCQCPPGFQGSTCSSATSCVLPTDPSDVLMVVSGQQAAYRPGDSVQYACLDGYQLIGSASRICRSDLTWSDAEPQCEKDPTPVSGCTPPTPGPSDVLMVVSGQQAAYQPGDSVQYACPDGYQLIGSASKICRSDLTWSGQQPTCNLTATSCVLPTDPSDVLMVVSGQQAAYQPGDSVQHACPDGYQLIGSASRICRSDLTWSDAEPQCEKGPTPVSGCTPPTPGPSDVLMVVSGQQAAYQPGDSVQYACPDGYQLIGSASRICRSDLTWSDAEPQCEEDLTQGKSTGTIPVATIGFASGGAVLLIAAVVIVAITVKRRRRRRFVGRLPAADTGDHTRKVFPDAYSTRVYYENHIAKEPLYCESIF